MQLLRLMTRISLLWIVHQYQIGLSKANFGEFRRLEETIPIEKARLLRCFSHISSVSVVIISACQRTSADIQNIP
jgi:hypothetical protein